ncbi:DeoR/GlpR family DNA-binding transcription regulator [Coraliomargarita sp. SDUM461004]|uniref:DeoR/GlpR family DNA-binding transcription regulator n=1 Tax=Thalassobacterium sedimentorum TaxID=3041258 RepID=A0ABU1AIC1_9BACT|nr:DeoR/GlpR family DNA-binding transcription regulator [Coraliomargarita sp. SDUM461004]MDQ8194559.1 DeoR/GlpR family DNA-binding transcription regulator [Coraliomargarita sp. SDUM461004]
MLAPERQQQILTLLEERGTVRTIDLAEEFQVTDETIRRDLQVLAENQQLSRVHGGASSLNGRPKLQSFTERRLLEVAKKDAIAKAALERIQPGQTYAFDSSTTSFQLVTMLPDLPYRVLTNAYAVIDQLVGMEQIDLISTGGNYHSKTQTFISGDSYNMLRRHNISCAFVSCIGLDINRGPSEGFEQQAVFKESLITMAQQTVLLVDSTKLNKSSEYFFANLHDISEIITDGDANPQFIQALRTQGCTVTIA